MRFFDSAKAQLVNRAPLRCFACEATYDTSANELMEGDPNCMDDPE